MIVTSPFIALTADANFWERFASEGFEKILLSSMTHNKHCVAA